MRSKQKRSLVYIAIPLSVEAKTELTALLARMSSNKYSWIEAEKAQILLINLGNLTGERAEDALTAVSKATTNRRAFSTNADGLGYFAKERAGADPSVGDKDRSRWVVYLDVPDRTKILRDLYKDLFKNLASEGFFPPTHYNPRITLGYLIDKKGSREDRENVLEDLLNSEDAALSDFLIDRINVYELVGNLPRLVRSFPLK